MKWFRLWIVLAGVFLAVRLAIAWAVPSSAPLGAPFWVRLAIVPGLQTAAAGWVLARSRRSGRP